MLNPTVAVYVDAQHLYHAARAAGDRLGLMIARPDYDTILTEAIRVAAKALDVDWTQVEVTSQRIYSASRNRTTAFDNALGRLGYDVQSYIVRSDSDNFDWDVDIVTDLFVDLIKMEAGELAGHVVVLVSGDGDFAPALKAVPVQYGVPAIALGYEGSMSSRFANAETLSPKTLYSRQDRSPDMPTDRGA